MLKKNYYRIAHPITERNCNTCGKLYTPVHMNQVFCSHDCRKPHYIKKTFKSVKLICRNCLSEFMGKVGQLYCSDECSHHYNQNRVYLRERVLKTCLKCGKEFTPWHNRAKFCSATCRIGSSKMRVVVKKCAFCGRDFETKFPGKKYCSQTCFTARKHKNRDHSHSKAKKTPCEHCGFSDLRAIHRHHINRSEQKGVMCLCANHHYIFHAIVGNGKKSENLNKSEVLALLTANSVSLVESALNSPVAQNKGIVESFAGAKTEV